MPVTALAERKKGLGRRYVAVLAQHGVHEIAVAVDGPIEVGPAATDLQVRLVHVPAAAAAGTAPAMPALAELVGQCRRELRFPLAGGLMAEDDPADEEHLAEVAQGQAVAQPPQHHERDDIGGVLGVVQHGAGALVELLAAIAAAEPAIALGFAIEFWPRRADGFWPTCRPPTYGLSVLPGAWNGQESQSGFVRAASPGA